MDFAPDFLLVIPSYCEQDRLPPYLTELVTTLSSAPFRSEILIVDDGSPEKARLQLANKIILGQFGNCRVTDHIVLEANKGKGNAILTGWTTPTNARWLAFVDADGAIPAYEVRRIFSVCHSLDDNSCRFGTRIRMLGRKVSRRYLRHCSGRLFATVVSALLNLGVYDTQCGFKVIPSSTFARIRHNLRETGLCFDIELLLALDFDGANILEVPIDWEDKSKGHVNIFRHGPQMMAELCFILLRTRKWKTELSKSILP